MRASHVKGVHGRIDDKCSEGGGAGAGSAEEDFSSVGTSCTCNTTTTPAATHLLTASAAALVAEGDSAWPSGGARVSSSFVLDAASAAAAGCFCFLGEEVAAPPPKSEGRELERSKG